MYGEAYICIPDRRSISSYIDSMSNPSLIQLPFNMRAKDIAIDKDNIYLLLQEKQ